MYELIQAGDRSYYIESPAKIGVVLTEENQVCLIDSGNDKSAGKKIKQILTRQGWHLAAIYNTHSHADHIGGNRYLQTQTGCPVYAPGIELDFTRHPLLEPSFLYGANPPGDLRHKFLMAQDSRAEELTNEVLPQGWEMISLPGHSFDMVGFRSPDDVVYLADCLSSRETLQKYQISFLVDVEAYLQTLEKVKTMEARLFIPSHAEPASEIAALAQVNIDKVHEIADRILAVCKEPKGTDQIIKALFDAYSLVLTFEQYALVGSTVRSYLAWLKDKGLVAADFSSNMLVWRS